MTTPAQNISTSGQFLSRYTRYKFDGTVVRQGDQLEAWPLRKFVRPESQNNPIRPDGSRRPGIYRAEWLRVTPPNGRVTVGRYSPNSSFSDRGMAQGCVMRAMVPAINRDPRDSMMRNTTLRALSQVSDGEKQFNASLAQMNGTIGLASQFSRAAGSRLDALMRGPRGLFRRLGPISGWREIPSEYLAYLYGIAPLGDDLARALDKLAWYRNRGFTASIICKAGSTREFSVSYVPGSIANGSGGHLNPNTLKARIPGTSRITTRCAFRFDVPAEIWDRSPTLAPFSTIYELVPYSFVLDWFLPVGAWIGALESAQYSPYFKEGWTFSFIRDVYNFADLQYQPTRMDESISMTGRLEIGEMARSRYTEYPWGLLAPPALNPLPGLHQAAQGLALLTQAFKRWY